MTLVVGVIATSPAGGDRTQAREVAHDFELVDFQPLDTGDDEAMMEESDEDTSSETPTTEDPSTEEMVFENCDAARDAGAAPVLEGEAGFGEHLDADNDGIGCEHWAGPSNGETDTSAPGYQNCTEARADGKSDIGSDEEGYAEHLDRDNDGVACEN